MWIIQRYIIKEIVPWFFVGVAFFEVILLAQQVFKLVDMHVREHVPLMDIFQLFIYTIPFTTQLTIPLGIMVGTLMAISRLSGDEEITAMRSCGMSLLKIFIPTYMFGIFITLTHIGFHEWVVPWGNTNYVRTYREIMQVDPTLILMAEASLDRNDFIVQVDMVNHEDHSMEMIRIIDKQNNKMIMAQYGRFGSKDVEKNAFPLYLENTTTQTWHLDAPNNESEEGFWEKTNDKLTIYIPDQRRKQEDDIFNIKSWAISHLWKRIKEEENKGKVSNIMEIHEMFHTKVNLLLMEKKYLEVFGDLPVEQPEDEPPPDPETVEAPASEPLPSTTTFTSTSVIHGFLMLPVLENVWASVKSSWNKPKDPDCDIEDIYSNDSESAVNRHHVVVQESLEFPNINVLSIETNTAPVSPMSNADHPFYNSQLKTGVIERTTTGERIRFSIENECFTRDASSGLFFQPLDGLNGVGTDDPFDSRILWNGKTEAIPAAPNTTHTTTGESNRQTLPGRSTTFISPEKRTRSEMQAEQERLRLEKDTDKPSNNNSSKDSSKDSSVTNPPPPKPGEFKRDSHKPPNVKDRAAPAIPPKESEEPEPEKNPSPNSDKKTAEMPNRSEEGKKPPLVKKPVDPNRLSPDAMKKDGTSVDSKIAPNDFVPDGTPKENPDSTEPVKPSNEDPAETAKKYLLDQMDERKKRITHMETNLTKSKEQPTNQLLVNFWHEFHLKISIPFSCLAFTLISAPFGIFSGRLGRSLGMLFCFIITIVWFGIRIVSEMMFDKQILSPELSAWLPNLLLFSVGIILSIIKMRG